MKLFINNGKKLVNWSRLNKTRINKLAKVISQIFENTKTNKVNQNYEPYIHSRHLGKYLLSIKIIFQIIEIIIKYKGFNL